MTGAPTTSVSPRSRRRLRFSLRSLVLFSLCAAAAPMLWQKLPPWCAEYVIDTTESKAECKTINVGSKTLREVAPQRISIYKRDRQVFAFDFSSLTNSENVETYVWPQAPVTRCPSPDLSKLLLADEFHAVLCDIENCRIIFDELLDWENPQAPKQTYAEKPAVVFSPDSKYVAIGCRYRGEIDILDAATGKIETRIPIGNEWACKLKFSADGKQLLLERSAAIEIFNLDGTSVFTMNLDHHYFWRANACFRTPDERLPHSAVVILDRRDGLSIYNIADKKLIKQVSFGNELDYREFAGFSDDGRYFFTRRPQQERQSNDRQILVHETLTNTPFLTCSFNRGFEIQATDEDSVATASIGGGVCAVSNPAGDVQLWGLNSKSLIAEVIPRTLTTRPAVHAGYDGPETISCMPPARIAFHQLSSSAPALQNGGRIYTEGQHSARRINAGELERDYIIKRNHSEQWYGIMTVPEFWLALVLGIGFIWSVVRDWRELSRQTTAP